MKVPLKGREQWLVAGRAASAGYFLIIAMLLGSGAGYALDRWLGSQPWGLLGGFLLGMAAAARELYQIARTTHLGGTSTAPTHVDGTNPPPGDGP